MAEKEEAKEELLAKDLHKLSLHDSPSASTSFHEREDKEEKIQEQV